MAGTIVANTINTDTGLFSTQNAYLGIAKAWINFNGTTSSPSTIRSSFNITSVTKTGTGQYNLNFTTAMADANYVVVSFAKDVNISVIGGAGIDGTTAPTTTTYAKVASVNGAGSYYDYTYMMFAVLGN
jgi:hypothetical protein